LCSLECIQEGEGNISDRRYIFLHVTHILTSTIYPFTYFFNNGYNKNNTILFILSKKQKFGRIFEHFAAGFKPKLVFKGKLIDKTAQNHIGIGIELDDVSID